MRRRYGVAGLIRRSGCERSICDCPRAGEHRNAAGHDGNAGSWTGLERRRHWRRCVDAKASV
jgi:hypothetical protein